MSEVKCILLVGVGGQGTILMSKILSIGLMEMGFDVKMSEIHGMSQRGGSVTTQIKYGDKIFAPNIGAGEADVIVAFEKAEALRTLPYLKKGGRIIMDDREIFPTSVLTGVQEYPHNTVELLKAAGPKVTVVPAAEIAQKLGNIRVQNIVLLGALIQELDLPDVNWKRLVSGNVPQKALELNLVAFEKGRSIAMCV